jgi:hypothetical protein
VRDPGCAVSTSSRTVEDAGLMDRLVASCPSMKYEVPDVPPVLVLQGGQARRPGLRRAAARRPPAEFAGLGREEPVVLPGCGRPVGLRVRVRGRRRHGVVVAGHLSHPRLQEKEIPAYAGSSPLLRGAGSENLALRGRREL